jgi:hypothetical protein
MAEVNELALMMAIQAVDEKMFHLEEEMKHFGPDDEEFDELQLEYVDYMKAAHSLRASYEKVLVPGDSLPPYLKLLRVAGSGVSQAE